MKRPVWSRLLLTAYTVAWLFLLAGSHALFCETFMHNFSKVYRGPHLPALTKEIALPVMVGLDWPGLVAKTWVTFVVWGGLIGWPIGTLAFVWRTKDLDSARWIFLYSAMGYALFVAAIAFVTAIGLALPFWG